MAVQMMLAQITVFRVTNTDDSGEGSLRDAVNIVNALKEETTDSFRIVFDFTTNEEHVITLESFIYLEGSRVAIDASDCKGTVVLDGVDKSFVGLDFSINLYNITIKALKFRNFKCGIDVNVTRNACIDGCEFESNQYGVDLGDCISEVKNCTFIGNEVGVEVSDPWILGSDEEIVNNSVNNIHDNFIGITASNKEKGNESGIRIVDKKPTYIYDNVICCNQYGISFFNKGCDCYIRRNYIGINKKFAAHGNTEAGISIGHNVGPIEIGSKDKADGNFIGYNKVGIVNDKGGVRTYYNYIGVTPDFEPMPNEEAGIVAQSVTSEGNYIGFNGTNGMEVTSYSTIDHDYIGGDGIHSFPNEEYGVYGTLYGKITETLIFDNKKGGVMLDYTTGGNPGTQFEYSQCLFGGDQPFAVKRPDENITAPVIEKVYSDDDYIYIEGTVELLDEEKFTSTTLVLETEVTIELFSNDGGTESALRYLGSTVTDAKGKWLYQLEKSKYASHIVATATHQCHQSYSEGTKSRYTSRFSEPYFCAASLYDLTRFNYYVKTKREGKGDGSSWKDAMDGNDFAAVLPLVQDGTTFYVAAGEYLPKFGHNLKQTDDRSELCYEVNSKVTIIGGYPASAKADEKSEPDKYETVFNGDVLHDNKENPEGSARNLSFINYEDNLLNLFIQNDDLSVRGVKIKGFYDHERSSSPFRLNKDNLKLNLHSVDFNENNTSVFGSNQSEINIDSCRFVKGSGNAGYAGAISNKGTLIIKNSYFDECITPYSGGAILSDIGTTVDVENSTFENCYSQRGSVVYLSNNCSIRSVNSTYVNNISDNYVIGSESANCKCELYNNTILSNTTDANHVIYFSSNPELTLVGNVIESISVAGNSDNVTSNNNIYVCDLSSRGTAFSSVNEENAISLNAYDCTRFFEGRYVSSKDLFRATLSDNGGFTRTVALISDKSYDGTYIRFPLTETVVKKDQRGESRLLKTCMGAYEIGCGKDTTLVADTIVVGSKYKVDGKVYDKIGLYEKILTKHKSQLGCDSVVNHSLFVVPDPKIKEYYVKTSKTGAGDGSDWDNAMDPKDFAFVFENLKTEGVTFYVAAGEYHAVYNGWGKETNDRVSCWSSQHGANIYGGYDPLATGNASTTKPDLSLYRTIFTGDIKGDDKVVMENDCDDVFENFTDNMTSSMFTMKINGDVHISGIELTGMSYSRGSSPAIIRMQAEEGTDWNVTIDHCKFYVADKGVEMSGVGNFSVDQCEFDYIRNAAVFSDRNLHVSNSTFTYSNGVLFHGNNAEIVVENSTFVKNTSDIRAYNYEDKPSTSAKIYNNTFISCVGGANFILGDNLLASVEGNVFVGSAVQKSSDGYEAKQQVFANNLLACQNYEVGENVTEKDNIKVEDVASLYNGILEGTYTATTSIFNPKLTYKGAYTRTVALLKDELSGGTRIRFPRLENITVDQRGTDRLDKTCMGAYEIECGKDTTLVNDTIEVGSKYNVDGKVYDKIGLYKKILSKHKSQIGCDSVVNHTLLVVPNSKIKEYYVKTSKTGTGDGSDWDNAMDPKDFAFVFENLKTEGVTFYVAAGTYHAFYDGWGKEVNDKYAHWCSKHGANIYGGYDPLATGDASTTKQDFSLYRTIFTGDINGDDKVVMNDDCEFSFENFSDNMNSSMISMEVYGDVHISGIELTGMTFSHGTSPALIRLIAKSGTEYSATIDHCKLSVADKGIEANYIHNLTVDNCEFDYINNSAIYSNGDCKVSNSTFTYTTGISYSGNNTGLVVENSTFVKNRSDIQAYNFDGTLSAIAKIYNNTFISCKSGSYLSFYDNVSATVSGNIFAGSSISINKRDGEAKQQTFTNNLFACKTIDLGESGIEKDNVKVEDVASLYNGILEGTYTATTSIFNPKLTYKGAYTRTVALLKDKLSDGTSIRFPRLENITVDQRGTDRLDKTCMGAYELGCVTDTTIAEKNDTIYVGGKIFGQTFTEVGIHDSIFENLKSVDDCDSVVMHTVVVKPDPTKLNYYVKTKRWGKGDGSTWDDAMNGTDFATYLPLAPDGATFYVAEGEYMPVYDTYLKVPSKSSALSYVINSSVAIRGGYPNEATGTNVPSEPKKYHTIFEGKTKDGNISNMFTSTEDIKQELTFSGITVENTTGNVFHIDGSKDKILYLEKDSFVNNNMCVNMTSNGGQLFANYTVFNNNWGKCIYLISVDNISLQYVDFANNSEELLYSSVDTDLSGTLYMDHVNVNSNTASSGLEIYRYNTLIKNCEFVDNESKLLYFVGNNTSVSISNSKFKGNSGDNMICNYQTSDLYIDGCDFVNNNSIKDLFDFSSSKNHLYFTNSVVDGNVSNGNMMTVIGDIVNVENVTFNGNKVGSQKHLINGLSTCESNFIRNVFSDNKSVYDEGDLSNTSSLMYFFGYTVCNDNQNASTKLERNSILSNDFGNLIITTSGTSLILSNNTIGSNKTNTLIFSDGSDMWLYNNTIVGNEVVNNVIEEVSNYFNAYGNIILGNVDVSGEKAERIYINYGSLGDVVNNILPDVEMTMNSCTYFPDASNIISFAHTEKAYCENFQEITDRNEEILTTLFNGSFNKTTGLFSADFEIKEKLPVLPLKTDKLSNGTSIRFPRLENVLIDQRGVSRFDMTCMGAYEIGCLADTTLVNDTIYVGTELLGQTFTEVGKHDSIFENLVGIDGCDSVVMHTVVVKPDPTKLNYYVKTKRWGKGDGSSWDDAMNGTDFATHLPLAPAGSTFYVAEGEYKPVYDSNGNVSEYPLYNVNNSVSIYGGYPAGATGTDVPSEPDKYKTVLGYDVNSSFALFYSDKSDLLNFVLDGVYVNDYKSYVISMPSIDLTIRNSYFDGNNYISNVTNESSLNIINTEISKTQGTVFYMYGTKSVYMEDVKFVDNLSTISNVYGDGYGVVLKSVNALNNQGTFSFYGSKELLVENSDFTKNNVSGNLVETGGTIDIKNSIFDQNNNYRLVYSSLSFDDIYVNISNSKFSNNTTYMQIINGSGSQSPNCTVTESSFTDNESLGLMFMSGANDVTIKDCQFLSNKCKKQDPDLVSDEYLFQIQSSNIDKIDHCEFKGNESNSVFHATNCNGLDLTNCFFDNNDCNTKDMLTAIVNPGYKDIKTVVHIENNAMSNNKCRDLMFVFNSTNDVFLRNNTIVSNECADEIWYPKYSNLYMQNNTIVGNKCKSISFHDFRYKSMVGNFIFGNQYEVVYRIMSQDVEKDPSYNIMTICQDAYNLKVLNSTNIISEYYIDKIRSEIEKYPGSDDISDIKDLSADISTVLEGTYDATTGLFIPLLKDNGGLTPTVALLADKLPDGTSIRFPLTETSVTEDQRGVSRFDMTCMGAYEIGCDFENLETVSFASSMTNNNIVRDEQTKMYDNTCINDSLKVIFYLPGGCGTNLYGEVKIVYKYSDREDLNTMYLRYPQKLANVDRYETFIPYRQESSYIKYRIEVSDSKNDKIITSPSADGFWNVNSCDSLDVKIGDPEFSLCKEIGDKLSVFVRIEGDTETKGKLKLHYSESVTEESSPKFSDVEMVSQDGENYYAEDIELSEGTKYFDYFVTYSDENGNILNRLGNGEDNIIRVDVNSINEICVDPCNNIKLSSHILVELNDTLSFDIYRKNTKVELFLCDEKGVKLISQEYNDLPVETAKFTLISKLSLRSKELNLSYVHPYLLILKIDGKVSCMYVYLDRKKKDKDK